MLKLDLESVSLLTIYFPFSLSLVHSFSNSVFLYVILTVY